MKPVAGQPTGDQPAAATTAEGKVGDVPQPKKAPAFVRGKADTPGQTGWQGDQRKRAAEFAVQAARTSQPQGEVLIVRCQVRADQASHQPFLKILASNSIDWQEPPLVQSKAEEPQRSLGYEPKGQSKKEVAAEPLPAADKKAGLTDGPAAMPTPATPPESAPKAAPGAVEGVLVEATWDQVEATVAELSKRSDVYTSVALESPPGTSVPRRLDRYNRVAGQAANAPSMRSTEDKLQEGPADTDAEKAKGTNAANARRRGAAWAMGPIAAPTAPATTPPSGTSQPEAERLHRSRPDRQAVQQQQVAPEYPAPGQAARAGVETGRPTTPAATPAPAAGLGGMGVIGQRQTEPPAEQQSAPESVDAATEPRTYRVLFLFQTVPPPAKP